MNLIYLTGLLVYPLAIIPVIQSNILSANYFMTATVALFLKLTSFHHVLYDNRNLINRQDKLKKSKQNVEDWAVHFDINPQTYEIAS